MHQVDRGGGVELRDDLERPHVLHPDAHARRVRLGCFCDGNAAGIDVQARDGDVRVELGEEPRDDAVT
jgi:hypothetical protein